MDKVKVGYIFGLFGLRFSTNADGKGVKGR